MSVIQNALKPFEAYLISLSRNTVDGWYELEFGIPAKWVYSENKEIKCEVVVEDNEYRLLKIIPKTQKVTVDDLLNFFHIISETNEKISQREDEFKKRVERFKEEIEGETKKFYDELDLLKENSFKNIDTNFKKTSDELEKNESSKRGRGRILKTDEKKSPIVITNSDDDGTETTNT